LVHKSCFQNFLATLRNFSNGRREGGVCETLRDFCSQAAQSGDLVSAARAPIHFSIK
jgi:hypothetical protein